MPITAALDVIYSEKIPSQFATARAFWSVALRVMDQHINAHVAVVSLMALVDARLALRSALILALAVKLE
jgi:hypothetical protein